MDPPPSPSLYEFLVDDHDEIWGTPTVPPLLGADEGHQHGGQHATTPLGGHRTTMTSTENPIQTSNQSPLREPTARITSGTSSLPVPVSLPSQSLRSHSQPWLAAAHDSHFTSSSAPQARQFISQASLLPGHFQTPPPDWHQAFYGGGAYENCNHDYNNGPTSPPAAVAPVGTGLLGFDLAAPTDAALLGADYADISPLSTTTTTNTQRVTFGLWSPWLGQGPAAEFANVYSTVEPTKQKSTTTSTAARIQPAPLATVTTAPAHLPLLSGNRDDDQTNYDNQNGGGMASFKRLRKGKRPAESDGESSSGAEADLDHPEGMGGGAIRPTRTRTKSATGSGSGAASNSSGSLAQSPPKLRSASRSSKNSVSKPSETAEERRTRASHNLVEKQYRNRLNAQFEGLLHALPEHVRGGAPADEEPEQNHADGPLSAAAAAAAAADRRVSKAEVLDMARRHILSLEREHETLERRRNELLRNLEVMEGGDVPLGDEKPDLSNGRLDENGFVTRGTEKPTTRPSQKKQPMPEK